MRTRDYNTNDGLFSLKAKEQRRLRLSKELDIDTSLSSSPNVEESVYSDKSEAQQLIKTYKLRIRQLESDRKKLYKHIDECYNYIDLQKSNNGKLLARIQQLENLPERKTDEQPKRKGVSPFLHLFFISSLLLYALYLVVSLMTA